MKLNAFQRLLQTAAYRANAFGAITNEEYQVYVDNAHTYNEEEHSGLEQELEKKWRASFDAQKKELDTAAAKRDAEYAESNRKWKEQEEHRAYLKRRRVSCPPALQFELWDLSKKARNLKAINNNDMRFIRKEMREADTAWLQELRRRVQVELDKKLTVIANRKANRVRISCPPLNAFRLWDAVKQARQMRLITNSQVREYREIRNYGDKIELGDAALFIMEKIWKAKDLYNFKKKLKERHKARAGNRQAAYGEGTQEEPGPAILAA